MEAILLIVSLAILLSNVLIGAFRGVGRSALRLGTLILAAFLAFFLAKGISSAVSGLLAPVLEDLLSSNETLAEFVQTNPEMPALLQALAQMLAAPLLFLIFYMLLKSLTLIVYSILRKLLRIKGARKIGSFFGGAGIGLVIGLIGLVVFATPLVGYADFADRTMVALADGSGEGGDMGELAEYDRAYVKPMAETPIAGAAYTVVGDTLFDSLTTAEWNGEDTLLETEWFAIVSVVGDVQVLAEKPIAEYGERESLAIHTMVEHIGDSRIVTYLGGNTLSGMAQAFLEGRPFFGVEAPAMEDANATLILNGLLRVFATTTPALFESDLELFADLFDLLIKHRILAAFTEGEGEDADFVERMVASGFLDEVNALIKANERMRPVSVAIGDVGMNILIDQLGLPEEYRENHAQLMDDMSVALQDAVSEEGEISVEQLQAGLNEAFADSGVEITESTAEVIANGLSEEFTPEELKTLTVDQITDRLIERFGSVEQAKGMLDSLPEGAI